MKTSITSAALFIAICAISTGSQSQQVYRCGDAYSQKPCADAVIVDVSDPRSPAQKAQADARTQHESAAANALEKARLKEEAQLRSDRAKAAQSQAKKSATQPKNAASAAEAGSTGSAHHHAKKSPPKKKKEPEFFTARDTAPKPKKPASSAR